MDRILAHVHVYYPYLWPELKAILLNLPAQSVDLFVTFVERHEEVIADIEQTFPSATVEVVKNRGYDIGPFISIINRVDLTQYSYVLKLHTKRDVASGIIVGKRDLSYKRWRKCLLFPFRKELFFRKAFESFDRCPELGMVAHYECILSAEKDFKEEQEVVDGFLRERGIPMTPYAFVAGTMFLARAKLFQRLKEMNFSLDDFPDASDARKMQLAHIMERFLGNIVYQQGYVIQDTVTPFSRRLMRAVQVVLIACWRFLYTKKRTRSGKINVKICKITVFNKKISD